MKPFCKIAQRYNLRVLTGKYLTKKHHSCYVSYDSWFTFVLPAGINSVSTSLRNSVVYRKIHFRFITQRNIPSVVLSYVNVTDYNFIF